MGSKFVELRLPYYKQGDDLHHCIESTSTPLEALAAHAAMLRAAAKQLDDVAKVLKDEDEKFELDADTHFIGIELSAKVADRLVELELADRPFEEDEELDGDEEIVEGEV